MTEYSTTDLLKLVMLMREQLDDGTMRTCDRCGRAYFRMHKTEHLQTDCSNPPFGRGQP